MLKRTVIVFVAFFMVLASVGWSQYQSVLDLPKQRLALQQPTTLTVPTGYTASRLVQELSDRHWLDEPFKLKLLFKLQPELTKLRSGEYEVRVGDTLETLLDRLISGRSVQYRVTLIEGATVKEMLASLADNELLEKTLSATDAASLSTELGLNVDSSEGLFLAETYYFERGTTDKELLLRAHRMLNDVLDKHWQSRDITLPLESSYEALILASIIEKETGLSSERGQISGVFIRRLNRGMRLQTDPTVIYGLGERYQGNLTRKHLKESTPYNTYRIPALPPTPIALVGEDAIVAALNPEPGKALYFVAKGDGSHQFSDTLEQHNRAVREYQLKRRKDYRSTPEAN
ncbi:MULTISPECIES: endolytic transglycosylase MltG [unclassified Marinobacterium]|uniref:endolytic transglycosylase MltG n=1 Tax=unclassified Marinobacterium TaxID=2644139 RepID=UPI001569CB7F|nr:MULTISPECIES: endolytic transglycosylase MltG [unclassified Marinobacterium]